jgi:hypothetical protein
MTEQQPSTEALHVAEGFVDTKERWFKLAHRIDSLCEQRVAAEGERWQSPAPKGPQRLMEELWLDLVEKDDRTSPKEYPDMALLTREEFFGYLKHYASAVASEVLK